MHALLDGLTDSTAWWTIIVGACCSTACALLGCYLVLRRLSLIGDAISHAVLPGLVLAFLWSGTRNPLPMILGAMILGLLTAFLTEGFNRLGKVPTDSSMGVVFTSFFAIGVILITRYSSQIDIDPGCVLYGLIELAPIDTVQVLGAHVPRTFVTLAPMLAITIGFIMLFWKELKICSFDPALATAMGISAGLIHYLLMAMVAATTVTSFEAVGSILVIAMLIVPGATAHLLTDRLGPMLALSAAVACLASFFGYWGAVWLDTSVAGMIAVVAGLEFTLAVFFAPRHGIFARILHNNAVGLRVRREDALTHLWRMQERLNVATLSRKELERLIGGGWMARLALSRMVRGALLTARGRDLELSPDGRNTALKLMRAHRLWESFQTEELGRSPDLVDRSADRVEHFLTPETTAELDRSLANPKTDPHGKVIPQ